MEPCDISTPEMPVAAPDVLTMEVTLEETLVWKYKYVCWAEAVAQC
jgi:hypothetical protein